MANENNAKRCQFFGELYTGENAEMKTTSFRVPVGLLKDIATVCEYHEGAKMSQNEFISLALMELLRRVLLEDRGGMVLNIENPQQVAQPNEDTRAEVAAILAEVTALKIDKRLGFRTGINELVNFLFEKLCKENNGEAWQENAFYAQELAQLRENQHKKAGG